MLRLVLLLIACISLRRLALRSNQPVDAPSSPVSVDIIETSEANSEAALQAADDATEAWMSKQRLSFVRRVGDKLYEDDNKDFRFVSFCVPNMHVVEDPEV
jgi:hypothetical protein